MVLGNADRIHVRFWDLLVSVLMKENVMLTPKDRTDSLGWMLRTTQRLPI